MSRARPQDLTCKALVGIVTDYLEDALPPEERTRFEQHLVTCPACVAYVRQMRATASTAAVAVRAAVTEESIPEATKSALLDAFRNWRSS